MKRYENYRETVSPFLSSVPAHWTDIRIGHSYAIKSIGGHQDEPLLSVFLNRGVVSYTDTDMKQVHKPSEDMSAYQLVEPSDFVLNNQQAWRGSVGVSKYRGIVSPAYIVMKPTMDNNPKFMNYMLRETACIAQFVLASKGVGSIQRILSPIKLKSSVMVLPPRTEQDQIVRYLDWQVSKINRLIAAKRKQIENLIECEKQTISNVVLRGLHASPPKDSGNRWIGDIPENWSLLKLGNFCSFQNGISESGEFFTSGTPFVGYGDVYRHLELPQNVKGVAMSNEQQQEVFSVRKGDIFFTRTSENIEEVGMAAVCKNTIEKAVFSGFIIRCRPQSHIVDTDYIKYYLQIPAVRNHFSSTMNIVIRASLGQALLKQTPVVVPPMHEQQEIALYLEEKHGKYDKITQSILRQIDALDELKTRLISDVVTGQVDVRGIEVPEYKPVDETYVYKEPEENAKENCDEE